MKRIVGFYKNGDRYLKEMGSGKSSLYFFLFFFVLHSMREHILFSSSDFGRHLYSSSYLSPILCLASDILTIGTKNALEFSRILLSMEQNPY